MAICIAYLGVGAVAIPTGIISAGFVEQYQRKSSISDAKSIRNTAGLGLLCRLFWGFMAGIWVFNEYYLLKKKQVHHTFDKIPTKADTLACFLFYFTMCPDYSFTASTLPFAAMSFL